MELGIVGVLEGDGDKGRVPPTAHSSSPWSSRESRRLDATSAVIGTNASSRSSTSSSSLATKLADRVEEAAPER